MKHLKTFEYVVFLRDLNIGDYVLIDENNKYSHDLKSPQWIFINNTVGKIVNIDKYTKSVKIEYENISDNIKIFFIDEKFLTMSSAKIKYHAKTKEEVEAMIAMENYNL